MGAASITGGKRGQGEERFEGDSPFDYPVGALNVTRSRIGDHMLATDWRYYKEKERDGGR